MGWDREIWRARDASGGSFFCQGEWEGVVAGPTAFWGRHVRAIDLAGARSGGH